MKAEDAEEYTQSLGQIVAGSWRQIALAKRLGVPKALGLSTEDWVNDRLGGYARLAIAERHEAVQQLTSEGHSNRAIGQILGVDETTVRRDKDAANAAPPIVTDALSVKFSGSDAANAAPIDAIATLAADDEMRAVANAAEKRKENDEARAAIEAKPVVIPAGRYGCIVIDPPWPIEKIQRDVRPNQVGLDYPTMTEDQLAAFDLVSLAEDDCHLFCWATQKFLPVALRLIKRSWGFRYVCTFVWHKPGGFQPVKLPQYNCEFALYARRGSPRFIDTKGLCTCFNAPRREHSRKPDEFYDMLRLVTAEQRIDIFSREPRDGFAQYGNETEKFSA